MSNIPVFVIASGRMERGNLSLRIAKAFQSHDAFFISTKEKSL